MFDDFVENIKIICENAFSNEEIHFKVKEIFNNLNVDNFNEIIEDYIDINYYDIKQTTVNANQNPYYKYILYNSELFDIVHIKWTKNSESKIHDHPKNGCVVMVLNDGKLSEHTFLNSIKLNKIMRINTETLMYKDIGYKIADRELHKIKAEAYTETLHVYIPGNHKLKYYN